MSESPAGPADPLLRAIAEFRDEVNRLFDEQASRPVVRAGDYAPRPSISAPSEPADPRLRLDALAKHLDRRRHGGVPGGTERAERSSVS